MAAQEKSVPSLPVANSVLHTDWLVCVSNATGNSVTGLIPVNEIPIVLPALGTPANSASMNVASGTVWYDSGFLYVAVSNNVTKRVSLSSF